MNWSVKLQKIIYKTKSEFTPSACAIHNERPTFTGQSLVKIHTSRRTTPRQYQCKPSTTYPERRQEPAHTMRTALCM